jgi:hypothetical protein
MTNIYAFTQKKNRQVPATTGEIVKNAALPEVVACMRGADSTIRSRKSLCHRMKKFKPNPANNLHSPVRANSIAWFYFFPLKWILHSFYRLSQ